MDTVAEAFFVPGSADPSFAGGGSSVEQAVSITASEDPMSSERIVENPVLLLI